MLTTGSTKAGYLLKVLPVEHLHVHLSSSEMLHLTTNCILNSCFHIWLKGKLQDDRKESLIWQKVLSAKVDLLLQTLGHCPGFGGFSGRCNHSVRERARPHSITNYTTTGRPQCRRACLPTLLPHPTTTLAHTSKQSEAEKHLYVQM